MTVNTDNLKNNGIIKLDGTWDFYWNRLLSPEEIQSPLEKPDTNFVMDFWSSKGFSPRGIATYRLILNLEGENTPSTLGLELYSIYSAYRLYINGKLIASEGVLGLSAETEKSRAPRTSIFFGHDQDKLDIIFQVSNHHYLFRGGLGGPPVLGSAKTISSRKILKTGKDLFMVASFLFMGLYHIGLALFRSKDRSSLYLGLFSLTVSFRVFLISGEKIAFYVLPWLDVPLFNSFQQLGIFPLLPLFILYITHLFPNEKKPIINRFFIITSFVLLIARYFVHSFDLLLIYNPIILLGLVYIFYVLIKAIFHKRPESSVVVAGFVFIFLVSLNDILVSLSLLNTHYYLDLGFLIFLFFQTLILAHRFSRAFSQVENLSQNLASSNEALKRMDRLKDEFLANTTHELKTPLNGIIGLSESLTLSAATLLNQEQKNTLTLITVSGKKLFSLVNDILDFSKLKEDKIEINLCSTSPRTVTNTVFSLCLPLIKDKPIELINEISPTLPPVLADPGRLEQIIFNLLGNAIKFTEKGFIRFSAETNNKNIIFTLEDTGMGIPTKSLERIFESFEQVDGSMTRQQNGTGLGLAITRQLLELQDGNIHAVSDGKTGSKFIFTLPISHEKTAKNSIIPNSFIRDTSLISNKDPIEEQILSCDKLTKNKSTILVVDDDSINRRVLINHLNIEDYNILTASSGKEALNILDKTKPDIIILDVMMPMMSGYDVTREIRKKLSAVEIPIILLTAKNQTKDIVTGFRSGANDYLTKPFSREELIARVNIHTHISRINNAYSRFLPREFLDFLGNKSITDIALGDQIQTDVAVLFSDIRGFTTLSENMSSEEIFKLINSYLGHFCPYIRKNGGFIDKFIGDGIMAIFPDSLSNALNAALEMQKALPEYNLFCASQGWEPITFGIGIHSGSVIMGTVGETNRMDTTVMSDVVNTASRLEELTKEYNASILISDIILKEIPNLPHRVIGDVTIRGKNKIISIIEPLL